MQFIAPRDEIAIPEKDLPRVDELPKNHRHRGLFSNHFNNHSNRSSRDQSSETLDRPEEEEEVFASEGGLDIKKYPTHLQLLHALITVSRAYDSHEIYRKFVSLFDKALLHSRFNFLNCLPSIHVCLSLSTFL